MTSHREESISKIAIATLKIIKMFTLDFAVALVIKFAYNSTVALIWDLSAMGIWEAFILVMVARSLLGAIWAIIK